MINGIVIRQSFRVSPEATRTDPIDNPARTHFATMTQGFLAVEDVRLKVF